MVVTDTHNYPNTHEFRHALCCLIHYGLGPSISFEGPGMPGLGMLRGILLSTRRGRGGREVAIRYLLIFACFEIRVKKFFSLAVFHIVAAF